MWLVNLGLLNVEYEKYGINEKHGSNYKPNYLKSYQFN